MRRLLGILLGLLVCCSCGQSGRGRHKFIVDLNHTAEGSARLTALVSDSTFSVDVEPDANGCYIIGTDNMPTGVYQLELMDKTLPVLIRHDESQRVNGTMLLWDSLSFSSEETRVLVHVDRLRVQMAAMRDSLLKGADMVKSRQATLDSLASIRRLFRREADSLVQRYDTSLLVVPVLNLHGLYSFSNDAALFHDVMESLSERYPGVRAVTGLVDASARAEEIALLRTRFHAGSEAPFFAFISDQGDTLLLPDLGRRQVALALLGDSLSARDVMMMTAVAQKGVVLATGGRASDFTGRMGFAHGRFIQFNEMTRLQRFAPVFLVMGADGRVELLDLAEN